MNVWIIIGLIVTLIWQFIYVPNPKFNSLGNIAGNIVGFLLCTFLWPIPAILLIRRFVNLK